MVGVTTAATAVATVVEATAVGKVEGWAAEAMAVAMGKAAVVKAAAAVEAVGLVGC